MSDIASVEVVGADDTQDAEVEEALKDIEHIKQKFNFIRSQRILSEAVRIGGASSLLPIDVGDHSKEDCVSELMDQIDRLCIQEAALQYSLESDTIHKIRSSGVLSSKLQELLDLHLKQEIQVASMSSQVFIEFSKLQEAQENLTQSLEEYMRYEKKRSQQFKETSLYDDNESMIKLRTELKEIRFMQLIIPRIISQFEGDITQTEWLGKLCKEIRDPILSLDDIQ